MPSAMLDSSSSSSSNNSIEAEKLAAQGIAKPAKERETFARKIDFLFACVGFSVGLGNVWRFPYLAYKDGGGAFLLPYLICVVVGGVPMFFLEVALGQFMSQGGIKAWKICPIFQGIGFASVMVVFFLNCYYNVILAWAFYYLFSSFAKELPWTTCDNNWNTDACTNHFEVKEAINSTISNVTGLMTTIIDEDYNSSWTTLAPNETRIHVDPTTEFWERKVLGISSGIDQPGFIKWDITLCLLLAWIVVYFCIWKGIHGTGKVFYFTAPAPYVLMLILLIRGCTLDGAIEGIKYYMLPNFDRLTDMEVWSDAATQIFFSYSISLGALTALGSYNKFNHNSYRDSVIFACTNSGTSIFAGFAIFSVLGFMAKQQGVSVEHVAESGPGLAFIAYPKAVAQMPVPQLWSVLFFLMFLMLGLNSQFVGVEGLVTSIQDIVPSLRKSPKRELFILLACGVQCLVGLTMVTNGGMYVFQLFDYYSTSRVTVVIAFAECAAIAWVYGISRFYDNLEVMLGRRLNRYMWLGWTVIAPLYCVVVFAMSAITYSELTYERPTHLYIYPGWAVGIGWMLACSSIIFIPVVAAYKIFQCYFCGKPIKSLIRPSGLKPHQLRPQDMPEKKQDCESIQPLKPVAAANGDATTDKHSSV